jgi:uncharacterized protein
LAAYFFDSSALAKCYINETGSIWVRAITAPLSGHELYVLEIVEVEVVSAIVRRGKGGSLTRTAVATALAQFRHDLSTDYTALGISAQLLAAASFLAERHELRAYDALQLAAAVELNQFRSTAAQSTLILVSADIELNVAARANGLTVEDPNSHP